MFCLICDCLHPFDLFCIRSYLYCTNVSLDFEWTINNDIIASSSLDRTTRVWNPESGACLRVLSDNQSCGVMACRFQPLDDNMLLVSF